MEKSNAKTILIENRNKVEVIETTIKLTNDGEEETIINISLLILHGT